MGVVYDHSIAELSSLVQIEILNCIDYMLYSYRYIDTHGRKKTDLIEASSLTEAKEKLRSRHLLILSCEPMVKTKWKNQDQKRNQLSHDGLITFTTQLAQLLSSGMPLYEALLVLEEQYKGEKFHFILIHLAEEIKKGSSLSSAIAHFPKSFNSLYIAMVAAGEAVGTLDLSLNQLAELQKKQMHLKKQLLTSLLYPLFLFLFSCLVVFLLLIFVIPSLESLFEDRQVNGFTSIIMHISKFLRTQWGIYVPFFAISLGTMIYYFYRPQNRMHLHTVFLKIPFLNKLLIHTALARFCRTLSTLLKGGVNLISAIQLSRKVIYNPSLEIVFAKAEEKIVSGSLLSVELKKSSLIPSLVHRMLAIGEESGNAIGMLQKISEIYEEDIEKSLNRIMALAQPVVLIFMGGIVGIILLAVLLPLTDITSFLGD